ncbi:MAG: SDR family oxidoreductase [Aeromicrobium sp.]
MARIALVTGSSGGIGRAIALRLAREGIQVAVASRTDDRYPGTNDETVAIIRESGGTAEAFEVDLSVPSDRLGLVARVSERLGDVDILVNNAAVSTFEPIAVFRERRFDLMIDVQVKAPLQLTQQVLPAMRRKGRGWIINVSSPAAFHPRVDETAVEQGSAGTVYGMCKAALERLTTGTAVEVYADGIDVVALAPTAIVPTFGAAAFFTVDRFEQEPPEAMAEAVAVLVREDAPRRTGQILYSQSVLAEAGIPLPAMGAV